MKEICSEIRIKGPILTGGLVGHGQLPGFVGVIPTGGFIGWADSMVKRMKNLIYIAFLICLGLSAASAQTKTLSDTTDSEITDFRTDTFAEKTLIGKVVDVHDGDTATIFR